jgi:hypothetical protein
LASLITPPGFMPFVNSANASASGADASGLIGLTSLAGIVTALSLCEAGLVAAGALSPVLSYSLGNLLFAAARLGVVAYSGMRASGRLSRAAFNGAILSGVSSLVLCLSSVVAKSAFGTPILGVSAPEGVMLVVFFAVIIVSNAVVGAVLAALVAVIAKALGRS